LEARVAIVGDALKKHVCSVVSGKEPSMCIFLVFEWDISGHHDYGVC